MDVAPPILAAFHTVGQCECLSSLAATDRELKSRSPHFPLAMRKKERVWGQVKKESEPRNCISGHIGSKGSVVKCCFIYRGVGEPTDPPDRLHFPWEEFAVNAVVS